MLPLFQFHMPSAAPRSSVTELVSELKDMYTDWELALWFVQSNAWLGGLAPVKAIERPRAQCSTLHGPIGSSPTANPPLEPTRSGIGHGAHSTSASAAFRGSWQQADHRDPSRGPTPRISIIPLYRSPLAKLAWILWARLDDSASWRRPLDPDTRRLMRAIADAQPAGCRRTIARSNPGAIRFAAYAGASG